MKQIETTEQEALEKSVITLKEQTNNTNNDNQSVRPQDETNQETVVNKPYFPDTTEVLDSADDF